MTIDDDNLFYSLVLIQRGDNEDDDGRLMMTIDDDFFVDIACLVLIQRGYHRDRKSVNFPDGRLLAAKTFRITI